ncbi:hypothetical protein LC612_40070 [Nostoc sp. CHAB 5834]|nr:hypothetical protein [Nostoc sp. CHAB 5834]
MNAKIEDRPLHGSAADHRGVFLNIELVSRISRFQAAVDFVGIAANEMEGYTKTPSIYGLIGCAVEIIAEEGSRICEEIGELEVMVK